MHISTNAVGYFNCADLTARAESEYERLSRWHGGHFDELLEAWHSAIAARASAHQPRGTFAASALAMLAELDAAAEGNSAAGWILAALHHHTMMREAVGGMFDLKAG